MKRYMSALVPGETHEKLKWLYLSAAFFFIIAAYTVAKELKDSIFIAIVGKGYIPYAKMISILALVPLVLLYSKLVDNLKRYRLLTFYCFAYALLGFLFAFFLGHPTIGLSNTNAGAHRIFGWLFYFFIEGYSPFVVSVFWAFANSVTSPKEAKNGYGFMVSGSKLGGALSAAGAWLLLVLTQGDHGVFHLSDTHKHQILLVIASLLLLIAPLFILMLIRNVSGRYLHGYQAVYEVEKRRGKAKKAKTGMLSGIQMFVRAPYVFGIFCLVLCYEFIYSVLSFQRIAIAQQGGNETADMTANFFKYIFLTHLVGFLISFFGTRSLLKRLGERLCLLLIPVMTAILFIYFKLAGTEFAFLFFLISMRAIHYGFSYPVRESLYIPTVKELKFKSKSWIDAFGSKFSKANGHVFNALTSNLGATAFSFAQTIAFSVALGLWFLASWLLGNRYDKATKNNEVIGFDDNEQEPSVSSVSSQKS